MKTHQRGFTLIELLVVIAIIGILSAVVLASLSVARNKGSGTSIKANMSSLRAQAELVYDEAAIAPNYAGVCTDTKVVEFLTAARAATGGNGTCNSNQTAWAAAVPYKRDNGTVGGAYCVDSTGAAKMTYGTGSVSYTNVTGAGSSVAITTGAYKCN